MAEERKGNGASVSVDMDAHFVPLAPHFDSEMPLELKANAIADNLTVENFLALTTTSAGIQTLIDSESNKMVALTNRLNKDPNALPAFTRQMKRLSDLQFDLRVLRRLIECLDPSEAINRKLEEFAGTSSLTDVFDTLDQQIERVASLQTDDFYRAESVSRAGLPDFEARSVVSKDVATFEEALSMTTSKDDSPIGANKSTHKLNARGKTCYRVHKSQSNIKYYEEVSKTGCRVVAPREGRPQRAPAAHQSNAGMFQGSVPLSPERDLQDAAADMIETCRMNTGNKILKITGDADDPLVAGLLQYCKVQGYAYDNLSGYTLTKDDQEAVDRWSQRLHKDEIDPVQAELSQLVIAPALPKHEPMFHIASQQPAVISPEDEKMIEGMRIDFERGLQEVEHMIVKDGSVSPDVINKLQAVIQALTDAVGDSDSLEMLGAQRALLAVFPEILAGEKYKSSFFISESLYGEIGAVLNESEDELELDEDTDISLGGVIGRAVAIFEGVEERYNQADELSETARNDEDTVPTNLRIGSP